MVNSHPAELLLPNDQFSYCQEIRNNENHDASDPECSPGSIKREYTSTSELYSPSANQSLGKRDSPATECPLDSPDSMKQDSDSPSPTILWAAAAGGRDSDSNNLPSKQAAGNIKKRYNYNLLDLNAYILRDFKREINYVHQSVNGTN